MDSRAHRALRFTEDEAMEKGRVEGKSVTVLREAWQGDLGYDEKKNQVLVEYDDGVKTAVSYYDIKDRRRNVTDDIPMVSDETPAVDEYQEPLVTSYSTRFPKPSVVELPARYAAKKPVVKVIPKRKK